MSVKPTYKELEQRLQELEKAIRSLQKPVEHTERPAGIIDNSSPFITTCTTNDGEAGRPEEEELRAINLQRSEELTALKEFGREVNTTLSLERAIEAGLQCIRKAVNSDLAFLFLRQGERLILQDVQPSLARQRLDDAPEHRVGECLCGLAVMEDRPLYSLDISADRRCTWDECKMAGIISFAALPLRGPDGVVGVIGLASEVLRDFAKQSEFLETLASQVSGALVNARLFDDVKQELKERMKVETALRDSERQFRLLAENSADIISRHDPEGIFTYVSPACWITFGYHPDEMVGLSVFEFIHPADLEKIQQSLLLVVESLVVDTTTYRLRRKDGAYTWCESTSHSIRDQETRNVLEIQVTTRDITERRQAELALLESENRTRSIVESLPIGMHIYRLGSDGRLVFIGANPAADTILGVANSSFIGRTLEEAFPGLGDTEVPQRYRDVVAQGTPWQTEQIVYQEGNIQGAFEVHAFQIAPMTMAAAFNDITERKKAEIALQSLSKRQKAMLAAIPDIIMEVNTDKVYTWANQAGLTFFGADVIGREASSYFVEEQDTYKKVQPLFEGSQEVLYVRSWQRRVDGQKRLLAWWCRALEDEHNNVTGVLSSARDITEQKHLEEKLLQAQKMESIGRLAGGVAHDFNNMLQTILGHADLAIWKIEPDDPVWENLMEIQKAAKRSADLTRQLLAFARKQTVSPTVLDLNDTIKGMMKILSRLIGEDIHIIWKPGANLWPLMIDPTQVDQILANLAVNARDAISGVGTLSMGTENVVIDATHHVTQADFLPGEYVMLSVSDTGCGMDKDVLQNIYDPFFTTKEVGKGTGLGLATVYGIVKQNRGWINVYSEPDMGTTFKIYLPRAEQVVSVEPPVEEQSPAQGSETVLLVEDDESILNLGVDILRRFGYAVLAAQSPEQALALIRQHRPIHLLITDVVMPGMNGKDLRDKVVVLHPEIRAIFMSGYTADIIAQHGILDPGIHFLQKPFSVGTLAGKVREVLDGK
jgi:PAS domain S-box-containing protein